VREYSLGYRSEPQRVIRGRRPARGDRPPRHRWARDWHGENLTPLGGDLVVPIAEWARDGWSLSRTQPSQSERDEPADGGLGGQALGRGERVQAVAREFVRHDVVPDVAGPCGVG
jgi:hypothetical protein